MIVTGERLIGGIFYRPIDEYKGRELLQSDPEPSTGHHSYCVRTIGSSGMHFIGSEVHQIGNPNNTRGSAQSYIAFYRRLIDNYGFMGGSDENIKAFQRAIVEQLEKEMM